MALFKKQKLHYFFAYNHTCNDCNTAIVIQMLWATHCAIFILKENQKQSLFILFKVYSQQSEEEEFMYVIPHVRRKIFIIFLTNSHVTGLGPQIGPDFRIRGDTEVSHHLHKSFISFS